MENNIKKFLQNKQFSYKVVAEEEFDSFFQDYEDDLEIGIISTNRDYIFAMDKNKVIGFAILFNQENSVRMPIANTTSPPAITGLRPILSDNTPIGICNSACVNP